MGVRTEALHNAHDIAEGGLAVALAECCLAGGIGAKVELSEELELFGEAPGQAFIVSGPAGGLAGFRLIGTVGGTDLEISGRLKLPITELRRVRDGGLRYA
jgi:phosphoribosylformylglycinamidine synthase